MASVADELQKLGALKNEGLLTDAEFDVQKKKLLAEDEPAAETGSTDNTFQKFGLILLALFFVVGLAVGKHWGSTGTAEADSTTQWLADRMSQTTTDGPTARNVPPASPSSEPVAAAKPSPAPTPAPAVAQPAAKPAPVPAAKPAPVAAAKPAPSAAPRTAPNDSVWKVPVSDADAQIGPKDAPATVVLFSNFENSTCKSFAPNVQRLVKEYGKKVRVVFKHKVIPASPDGVLASEAALAAGAQGKFWAFHDKVMAEPLVPNRAGLEAIAKGLGLKMGPFKKALDKGTYKAQIAEDMALAEKVQARGTPNHFVNGRKLTGAKPFEEFKAIIDEELKKTAAMLKSGTSLEELYPKLIAKGKTFNPLDATVRKLSTPADAPSKGSPKSNIVITEFTDYQ